MKNNTQLHYIALLSSLLGLVMLSSCNNAKAQKCEIPTEITYSNNIASIIKTECFECHAPNVYKKKASRNKIYDYESLKKMAKSGFLIGSLTHQKKFIPMPYKKGTKIDTCKIATIAKWIDTGMKF